MWATIVIGTGSLLASEIIWPAMKYVHKKIQEVKSDEMQVLMFNEHGTICKIQHMQSRTYKCNNPYCSKDRVDRIIREINNAKYSIDMAIYTFTYKRLLYAFINAHRRGVIVRIIYDKEMIITTGSQICALARVGCEYRAPNSNTAMMHHKFMVIDGKQRVDEIKRENKNKNIKLNHAYKSVAIHGSVNWTHQGFCGNWENCVISYFIPDTEAFQAEFSRLWKALEFQRAAEPQLKSSSKKTSIY